MIMGLFAMILLLLIVIFLMNRLFLSGFYFRDRQKKLKSAFNEFNTASTDLKLYDSDYFYTIEEICANGNMSVIVISPNNRVVLSSVTDAEVMRAQLMDALFKDRGEVLVTTDTYVLRQQKDPRMDNDYLILIGTLSDGNIILIRTAVQSMENAQAITNRFLIYAGIVVCVVGLLYAAVFSGMLLRPIHEMNDLAGRMAKMDFEASYRRREYPNELDDLGEHLNVLSMELEKNIGELKKANADLESDLRGREENERMRQEFLSNVSHELKTPLALVLGYAEGLLEDVSDDPESRNQYCEVIIDETKKMSTLVSELLTLNELEFSTADYTPERFDIVKMIDDVLEANMLLFEQNRISVSFANNDPIFVWGDAFKVEQVLKNYLSNAIHYVGGEKHIDIRLDESPSEVRIHVFNTGEPIDENKLPHIWEKFYKVDEARSREYGGSGIGLSVVKAIMDTFQKEYGADNFDNGVDFWFCLDK